jgi:hypothetical protein
MGAWSRLRQEVSALRVVFVARKVDRSFRSACASRGKGVVLALDPADEVARQFNARWTPRAFLLDGGGRLRYVQPVTTMTPQAPLELREVVRAASQVASRTPGGGY